MSIYSLDPDMNFEVLARFIGKGHEQPVTGGAYTVRLFDADLTSDDHLGECTLDENGFAKIKFKHADFGGALQLESNPDLYLVVYKHKAEIFRTGIMKDINLESLEKFKMGEGEVIDLGTYLIES